MARDISIKGGHFVWLLWQNFKVGNLWNTNNERRQYEAPAGKEVHVMHQQGKNVKHQQGKKTLQSLHLALVAIFFSLVEPF